MVKFPNTADTIEVILFDGEVDPFFFTEDHINGCNPLGLSLNLTSSMRPQCTIIFKKKVARWPHGCRRKYSEVAVPMLVGSNPTEGGRIFSKEGTSAGADGRVVEGRINTLSATTARALTAISTLSTASTDYEEEELRIAIENEEHAPTTS
ncbi:hypothetical protein MTP99_008380 [Tenebrio molitor]|nr:hypothetical protein MTP99_008380 [Tenebrio molitor]